MKLEIDLSDRRQLESLKQELERYLSIVEFALSQPRDARKNGNDTALPLVFATPNEEVASKGTDAPVRYIIGQLPNKFTTTDVFLKFGEDAKQKRGAIKMSMKRAEADGLIRVAEPGRGRKPTRYEKVSRQVRE